MFTVSFLLFHLGFISNLSAFKFSVKTPNLNIKDLNHPATNREQKKNILSMSIFGNVETRLDKLWFQLDMQI